MFVNQIRAALGLVTAVGLLAMLAAPASAEWKSLNGTSHGLGILKAGTTVIFTINGGAPEVKCAKVPEEWKLLKSDTSQEPATTGGHLQLKSKWEECTVAVLGIKVPFQISGCELELQQRMAGVFTATVVINGNCIVTVQTKPTCIIEISGQNGENQGLKEIKLVNVGKNQEDPTNISEIKSKTEKTTKTRCEELGFKPGKGTLKAVFIMNELNAF